MTAPSVKGHVLVVEDDPDTSYTIGELLQAHGYTVTGVADGLAALEYLRRSPRLCLILLDLQTPRMDGWQFRSEQRQDPALAAIPVVVVTGTAVSLEAARQLDADGYLMKP